MSRWLLRLEAKTEDLREFQHWFPNGPAYVFGEGGEYFLAGSALEVHAEAANAMTAAEELLEELFAVVSLLSRSVNHPKLAAIFRENDAGVRQEHPLLQAEIRIGLTGLVKGNGGPTQAQQMLFGSSTDPRLRTSLLLWAEERRTWPRLYRILEEIELYLGRHADQAKLCSGEQRTRFRQCANVAAVAGSDARHASGKFAPPPQPMTLREASSFISSLLQAVFRAAAP
jgi:hypothetical protein